MRTSQDSIRIMRSESLVICNEDTPVGMGMYHDCTDLDAFVFSQILIDDRYKIRRYGEAATKLVLDEMNMYDKYSKAPEVTPGLTFVN